MSCVNSLQKHSLHGVFTNIWLPQENDAEVFPEGALKVILRAAWFEVVTGSFLSFYKGTKPHCETQSLSYRTPTKPSFWNCSQNYLIRSRKQRKQLLNITSQNCIALTSSLQAGFSKHIMKLQVDVMGSWPTTNLDAININHCGRPSQLRGSTPRHSSSTPILAFLLQKFKKKGAEVK